MLLNENLVFTAKHTHHMNNKVARHGGAWLLHAL